MRSSCTRVCACCINSHLPIVTASPFQVRYCKIVREDMVWRREMEAFARRDYVKQQDAANE